MGTPSDKYQEEEQFFVLVNQPSQKCPDTPTGMKRILLAFYDIVARLRGRGAGYPFESFLQRFSYLCGTRSLCVANIFQKLQKTKRPEK